MCLGMLLFVRAADRAGRRVEPVTSVLVSIGEDTAQSTNTGSRVKSCCGFQSRKSGWRIWIRRRKRENVTESTGRPFGFVVDRLPDPVHQLGQELGLARWLLVAGAGRWGASRGALLPRHQNMPCQ